ncbi:MAG: hypothetical protein ACI4PF_00315 [Christensenellales bacterium]
MKIFTYSYPTASYYSEQTNEECYSSASFDYAVDDSKIKQALANMIYDGEFSKLFPGQDKQMKNLIVKCLEKIIEGYDLQNKLEEDLNEDLKDYFEEYAFKSLKE